MIVEFRLLALDVRAERATASVTQEAANDIEDTFGRISKMI